ncbi:MAG: methyltransferase domain-containing protein [Hormoscilla sp. GUM202]|nr:methyltransferase domain-containing protein [Hormoscilla sp. GUM202]
MSEIQPSKWLKWICSSKNLDELCENYDRWAITYETDVGGVWEPVPLAAALMLAEYIDDKQCAILDAGAGTGLVGVALAELGFKQIIAIDISSSMLAKAVAKGVYSSSLCCSIGDRLFRNLKRVSGIIAAGVFAEAHAGAAELLALSEKIIDEGVLVFTARQSFLPQLQEVVNRPEWSPINSKAMPIYDDPMHLLAYRIKKTTES